MELECVWWQRIDENKEAKRRNWEKGEKTSEVNERVSESESESEREREREREEEEEETRGEREER